MKRASKVAAIIGILALSLAGCVKNSQIGPENKAKQPLPGQADTKETENSPVQSGIDEKTNAAESLNQPNDSAQKTDVSGEGSISAPTIDNSGANAVSVDDMSQIVKNLNAINGSVQGMDENEELQSQ